MGLASKIAEGAPPDVRRRCSVGAWVNTLNDADRVALDATVPLASKGRDGWTISALWRACAAEGLTAQRDKFSKHLKGECACGPR